MLSKCRAGMVRSKGQFQPTFGHQRRARFKTALRLVLSESHPAKMTTEARNLHKNRDGTNTMPTEN
jgi:hypothetical protein